MKRSIAKFEQQGRVLKTQNAPAHEIAMNDAYVAERRKQLAVALAPTSTATKAVGLNEALNLDKALQTSIADLRKEFNTLFARYAAYLRELAAVDVTRNAITANQKKAQ